MTIFVSENNTLGAGTGHSGIVDLRQGGQQGLKRDADLWFHNSLYVRQPTICVLMAAPLGFQYLPDGDKLGQMLKSLVEIHTIGVTGLDTSITNNFDEKALNSSGEVMQTHTQTLRNRSNPTFSWAELDGKPITRLLKYWTQYLLSDDNSNIPAISGVQAYIDAGSPHLTPRDKSMTCMFIEPTHNRRDVNFAVICSNMMPINVPDTADFTKGTAGESPQLDIQFTALTNDKVDDIAKAYLDTLDKSAYLPGAFGVEQREIQASLGDDAAPDGYRPFASKAAAALNT